MTRKQIKCDLNIIFKQKLKLSVDVIFIGLYKDNLVCVFLV